MLSGRGDGRSLSFIEDYSLSTTQYLVPAWECLEEAFKAPSFQLKNGSLDFRGLVPDLFCADYPASLLITVPESHMIGVKIQEGKGMFLRQYYTDKVMEGSRKRLGAEKMVRPFGKEMLTVTSFIVCSETTCYKTPKGS